MATNQKASVVQINVSSGGVPKQAVASVIVSELGAVTDSQNDTVHHGGPDRALVIYSWELIEALKGEGHPISPGSIGENVTIQGLEWAELQPGVTLQIGQVMAQITRYATPCSKISGSFVDGDFNRVGHKLYPGWSRLCLRVLEPGMIKTGDEVVRVQDDSWW